MLEIVILALDLRRALLQVLALAGEAPVRDQRRQRGRDPHREPEQQGRRERALQHRGNPHEADLPLGAKIDFALREPAQQVFSESQPDPGTNNTKFSGAGYPTTAEAVVSPSIAILNHDSARIEDES